MSVELKDVSELGRELSFVVEKDEVAKERQELVREFSKEAAIEGFRKGKVPEHLVEARFAEAIREQLIRHIVPRLYVDAVKEHKLTPIVEPDVFDLKVEDGVMTFKTYVEIRPEITIKKYKGLLLKKAAPEEISEEKVEEVLREWEKKPEFAASVIDPEKARAWRQRIREQMEYIAGRKALVQEDNQLWEQLLSQGQFPLPGKLVGEQAKKLTEEQLRRMDVKDKSQAELDTLVKETYEQVKPAAEQEVKRYLILDTIARQENIAATDEELEQRVQHISRVTGEPLDTVRQKLGNAGRLDDIREEIRIDKAFVFVKENAEKIEKVVTI